MHAGVPEEVQDILHMCTCIFTVAPQNSGSDALNRITCIHVGLALGVASRPGLGALQVCLKGTLFTPLSAHNTSTQSLNVQLRKELDLHVNLVHGFNIPGVPSRFSDVDVVVIRCGLPGCYRVKAYDLVLWGNTELSEGRVGRSCILRVVDCVLLITRHSLTAWSKPPCHAAGCMLWRRSTASGQALTAWRSLRLSLVVCVFSAVL